MYCPNCGFKNEEGSTYCGNCGTNMNVKTTIVYPNENATTNNDKYNGMAIAGFVLSIVNIWFGAIFVVGVIGLILSVMGNNQIKQNGGKGKGLAVAGIVINIITLSLYFLVYVFVIGIAGCAACGLMYL